MSLRETKTDHLSDEPVRFPPKHDHHIRWLLGAAAVLGALAWATWPTAPAAEPEPLDVHAILVRVAAGEHVGTTEQTLSLLEAVADGSVRADDLLDYDPRTATGRELVLVFYHEVEQLSAHVRQLDRHFKLTRLDPNLSDEERDQRLTEIQDAKLQAAAALNDVIDSAETHIIEREGAGSRR